MKEIQLSRGYITIVDDADFDWLSQWKWTAIKYVNGTVYAVRRARVSEDRSRRPIPIHRVILNAPIDMVVDHINHDPLDNRRENLRICTRAQNNKNLRRNKRNTSGYKGVYWDALGGKWATKIRLDNKYIWLGRYDKIEDAAEAYRKASLQYHGEFGCSE